MTKAQSEVIVPGPHGLVDYQQTIVELKRILKLHLKAVGAPETTVAQVAQ